MDQKDGVHNIRDHILYFSKLPLPDAEWVESRIRVVTMQKEDILFSEGDPAEGLYYVVQGGIQIVRYSPDGRHLVVREFRSGETLNEVGALDATTNAATGVCHVANTVVWVVPGEIVRELAVKHPEMGAEMMRAMAKKLRFAMQRINNLALMDVKSRLATFLIEQADDANEVHGFSHEYLAARLGTVRQVISRAVADFKKEGLVQTGRNLIRITDTVQLKKVAESS